MNAAPRIAPGADGIGRAPRYPGGASARDHLMPNKKAPSLLSAGLLPKTDRGNWRSFEPSGDVLAPFLDAFGGTPEPYTLAPASILRRSA
jgi:hypothetical protein